MPVFVVVRGDGVARGAGHRGDDVAFLAQQGIGQRRFAHVRLAHDREAGESLIGVLYVAGLLGQEFHDFVEQVAGAAAGSGGNGHRVAKPQTVELIAVVHLVAGIHLVDSQDHGLAATAQDVGNLFVVVGDAGSSLDHEEHQIALLDGNQHLLADLALEHIFAVRSETARIDHRELVAAPFAFAVMAVARHARRFIDDGLADAHQPVEQSRFAHIRASYDSYKIHKYFGKFNGNQSPRSNRSTG